MIVVRLGLSLRQSPTVERFVDLHQNIVPKFVVRSPTSVGLRKLRNQGKNFRIEFWQAVLVEVSLNVICIEENKEQKLFILIFLKE